MKLGVAMTCHFAKRHILFIVMLNVIMLSAVILNNHYAECRYAECRAGAASDGQQKLMASTTLSCWGGGGRSA